MIRRRHKQTVSQIPMHTNKRALSSILTHAYTHINTICLPCIVTAFGHSPRTCNDMYRICCYTITWKHSTGCVFSHGSMKRSRISFFFFFFKINANQAELYRSKVGLSHRYLPVAFSFISVTPDNLISVVLLLCMCVEL